MNTLTFKGIWHGVKGSLIQKWAAITKNTHLHHCGHNKEMIEGMPCRLAYAKIPVEKITRFR